MRNEVLLKAFWYGLCENAWFPWQPLLYDSRDWGVGLQIQSYLASSNPRALKLMSNLSLDTCHLFGGEICKSYNLHICKY